MNLAERWLRLLAIALRTFAALLNVAADELEKESGKMSKLIRDLGEGKSYTLAVLTSSAGIELVSAPRDVHRDDTSSTVTLTSDDALDLAFALETAASHHRAVPVTGLNALRDAALRIAIEHGFTEATIGEDVALFHSEASELLEEHRAGVSPTEVWYEEKLPPEVAGPRERTTRVRIHNRPGDNRKPCGIPSECADILIRVFHFCGKHGIDIEKAVREKMAYNESRPHKHGGKVL